MVNKQKIDASYLKLISVTLMMAAACVPASGQKHALDLSKNANVREIILEHFHLFSSAHLSDVVEWENAIKQVTEIKPEYNDYNRLIYFKLLVADDAFNSLLLNDLSGVESAYVFLKNSSSIPTFLIGYYTERHPLKNLNKYSLVTRAGPLA